MGNNEAVYMIMTSMMSGLGGLGLFSLIGYNNDFMVFLSAAMAGIIAMLVMTTPHIDWRDKK